MCKCKTLVSLKLKYINYISNKNIDEINKALKLINNLKCENLIDEKNILLLIIDNIINNNKEIDNIISSSSASTSETSSSFTYNILNSDYNLKIPPKPINNNSKSFTVLTEKKGQIKTDNTIDVTWDFTYKTIVNEDGLYIKGHLDNINSVKIINFGNIPLTRNARQFQNYRGTFLTSGIPLLQSDTGISYCFDGAINFNNPFNNDWAANIKNLKSSKSFDYLFRNASSFNQSLNNWDTSLIITMQFTFNEAKKFNQPLNNWNTSSVTNMQSLFNGAKAFNQDISSWNFDKVLNMENMLDNCGMNATNYLNLLKKWNLSTLLNKNLNIGVKNLPSNVDIVNYENELIKKNGWTFVR